MRLHELVLRGVSTAFRDSLVRIDFDAIEPGLVAIVGPNGGGKTTLLEATGPMALYRRSPSYDESLTARIVPGVRNAMQQLRFSLYDQEYVSTLQADPMANGGRGKMEAVLSNNGDKWGPGVREYDAQIAKLFPPEDVWLASAFAGQGGGGSFFQLDPVERRKVLGVLLALARHARAAKVAAQLELAASKEVSKLLIYVEQSQQAATSAEELRPHLAHYREEAARWRAMVDLARPIAEEKAARWTAAVAEARAAVDAVKVDVVLPEPEAEVARTRDALVAAQRVADDCAARTREAGQRLAEQTRQVGEHTTRRARLQKELARQVDRTPELVDEDAAAIHRRLDDHFPKLKALDAENAEAEAELKRIHKVRGERALDAAGLGRDREVAELLEAIPGVPACEECPLTADARAARDRMPERQKRLQSPDPDLPGATARVTAARDARTAWHTEEARLSALHASREVYDATVEESTAVGVALAAYRATEAEARAALLVVEAELAVATDTHTAAQAAHVAAEHALALARVDARRAATEEATRTKNAALGAQAEKNATADTLREREEGLRQAELDVARAEERLAAAEAAAGPLETQQVALEGCRQESHDLVVTGRVFDLAQALAIDAAGPGISGLANELLLACYGGRFALRFITTELKKSPKPGESPWKEVCDVEIFDAEQGRVINRGSPGQMVILDEALRLAVALYNVQHHGFPCETLWRDETSGMLSPEAADQYIALLRRARELGGFRHILFIAHSPNIWKQAETRIHVDVNGTGQNQVRLEGL